MKKYRTLLLIGIDIAIFVGIYIGCSFLNSIVHPDRNLTTATYIISGLWFLALPMLLRFVLRVYSNVWRYANSAAYLKMLISDCTGGVVAVFSAAGMGLNDGLVLNSLIITMFSLISLATRFLYQQYYRHLNVSLADINKIGVCIVGAGQLGSLLAEELLYNSASHYRPICFVDRDVAKVGGRVCGLKVYPEGEELIEQLKALPIQEIFLALPSIDGDTAAKLYNYYSQTGCKVKLYDYPLRNMTGEPADGRRMLREIRIEDLLFRRSLEINDSSSLEFYRDKTVLVTGGGGSIGSELCRQIAKLSPRRLVVLDIYENNAYEIQQELSRRYGDTLSLSVEIGSVRDRARLEEIFATYRPDVVFHAAAHKHVPLMEHSSAEVIKNNILGTYNTADMAEKYGTGKFILISTDKAVNPTNVMGASKRMCEMLIECRCDSKTTFAAVRFGNVLGSNGSVIPLFRKQIAEGGPITTCKDLSFRS